MGNDLLFNSDMALKVDSSSTENKKRIVFSSNGSLGFDTYLDTARSKESNNAPAVDSAKYDKRRQASRAKNNDADRHAKKTNTNQKESDSAPVDKNKSKPDSLDTASVKKPNNAKDTNKIESDTKPDEEAAMKKIAELLGQPYEKVKEILNTLNMSAFDLLKSENMTEFLVEALSVTDFSDLLEIPHIKELYVEIHTTLDKMAEELTTEAPAQMGSASESFMDVNATTEMTTELDYAELVSESEGNAQDSANVKGANLEQQAGLNVLTLGESEDALATELLDQVVETVVTTVASSDSGMNSMADGFGARGQGNDSSYAAHDEINAADAENHHVNLQLNSNSMAAFREIQAKAQTPVSSRGINTNDVINQVIDKIKVDVSTNVSEIRLTLRPESLGEVSLKIALENGILTAQFTAENQRVKALIESNFSQLRDALQQQGLDVAELYVSVGQDDSQSRREMFDMGRHKNSSRIRQIMGIDGAEDDESELQENISADSMVDVIA